MTEERARSEPRASALGRAAGAALRALRQFGGESPIHILPYRGYGRPDSLFVRGRVLEDPGIGPAGKGDPWWRNVISTYKRIDSDEIPGAGVRVSAGDATLDLVSDAEGFFEGWIRPAPPLDANLLWHDVGIELTHPVRAGAAHARTHGRVLVPPRGAHFAVISDLDDTVIRTHATDLLRMLREVLFGNVHTRLPFDGVAAFYRALHAGTHEPAGGIVNPIFYVSSSPWNLYDIVFEFLEIHRIPVGPLELRDWGIRKLTGVPFRHRAHKREAIERVLATYPDLPFILIGDSGQQDPEIYHEVVHDFPDRIFAVYIRNVTEAAERSSRIQSLADEILRAGSTLVLADDTAALAEHAAEQGWISALDEQDVRAEAAEDTAAKAAGAPGARRGERPTATVRVERRAVPRDAARTP
ncbi:MAG: App1 family protein [Longimicrobiales bacterium]